MNEKELCMFEDGACLGYYDENFDECRICACAEECRDATRDGTTVEALRNAMSERGFAKNDVD